MSSSETAVTEPKEIRTLCRHIFTDGRRCASPALRGPEGPEPFCYHHHSWRKPIKRKSFTPPLGDIFSLPDPEDRSAIQVSIGHILQRICLGEIDNKRAGLLLYGLQIAAGNLRPEPRDSTPERPIEQTVEDPELGTVAPFAEFNIRSSRRTEYELQLEREVEDLTQRCSKAMDETANTRAEWGKCEGLLAKATLRLRELESQQTLPTVQAVAEPTYPHLTPIRTRFYPKRVGGGGTRATRCPDPALKVWSYALKGRGFSPAVKSAKTPGFSPGGKEVPKQDSSPRLTPIRTRLYPKTGGRGVLGQQINHRPRHAFHRKLTNRQQPLPNSV